MTTDNAPPAGPETGWLTMEWDGPQWKAIADALVSTPSTTQPWMLSLMHGEAVAQRRRAEEYREGHEVAAANSDRLWHEANELRSALTAATERAAELQRERDNDRLAFIESVAAGGRVNDQYRAALDAVESSRAAALTLAGEAVEMIGTTPNVQPITDSRVAEYMSLRARLASLAKGDG